MIGKTMLAGGAFLCTLLMPHPAEALPGGCEGMVGVAHRGDRTTYTENTLNAFRDARTFGADAVETDVRITADGRFMLMHATSIDRTTTGTGEIADLQSSDVRSVRTNDGGKVPFLTEALHATQVATPTAQMFIELKRDDPFWQQSNESSVSRAKTFVSIIRHQDMSERVTVTGNRRLLSYVRQVDPSIRTALKSPPIPLLRTSAGMRTATPSAGLTDTQKSRWKRCMLPV